MRKMWASLRQMANRTGYVCIVLVVAGMVPAFAQGQLPAAAKAVVSETLGRDDARYQVGSVAGAQRAENPAQGLQTDFTRQGMEVRTSGGAQWRLELRGYGYGDRLEKVAEAAPESRGNRVEYGRGPLVEWYVNGPAGVEQGFTLSAPPASGVSRTRNSSPLTIALAIGGNLTATGDAPAEGRRDGRAKGLTLRDGSGQVVLRYTGLTAHDASGRKLEAWLELGREELRLRVEDSGAQYPVVVDPFVQQQELIASDGAANDEFGWSVALSGDGNTALVGAFAKTIGSNETEGATYVFTLSGGTWTQQQELTASDGGAGDFFGYAVALSNDGNTALVGAWRENSAYVFTRSGTIWTQQQELNGSDQFGYSVALSSDGNTALVGAIFGGNSNQGAAYVFTRAGTIWTQQQELTASDGAAGDLFGYSVALSGDGNTVLVGAYFHKSEQGAAYVFTLSGGSWTQQAELTASDGGTDDTFGFSVALSSDGNTALVGAFGKNSNQGAAYVFTRSGVIWTQQQELTASDGAGGDFFGDAVALSSDGNTALVGADGKNSSQGAAYVFTRSGTIWTQQQELTASDGEGDDLFATSVALSGDGNTALVGAWGKNSTQGAAYVFGIPLATNTALTSSPNPSAFGQFVTFTATVTAATGTPTGTVTFLDGVITLGTATLNGSGIASLTITTLAVGSHLITASYSGNANYAPSVSSVVTQVVDPAATMTTITANPNPSAPGQPVTFTATVTAATGTPTGTVTFLDGVTTLGTATLNGSGIASLTITTLAVGSHLITASYSGSGNFSPSSGTVLQTVAAPPTISKSFAESTVPLNHSTGLTFDLTNPNATVSLSGVGFTDPLPSGLIVATPNGLTGSCGGGTITATAGSASITLSGATLGDNASCTFTVNVTGTVAGIQNNTTSVVTSTQGGNGGTASASITVVAPPTIRKAFAASSILVGGSTALSFTISNPNATVSLTGVAFIDPLPSGLVVSTPNGLTGSCGGGTITATAGSTSISLSGATLGDSASCTFAVSVTGKTAGKQVNTTSAVTSSNGGTGNQASATVTVLAPGLVDYFSNANTPGAADGTVRISNPGTTGGNLCADIFVFDANEELSECCSCSLTPDALLTLSVNTDLTGNPLTGNLLSTGVITIIPAATIGGVCPLPTTMTPTPALDAWATHIQSGESGFVVTDGNSQTTEVSAQNLSALKAQCANIKLVGSGHGVCANSAALAAICNN